METINYKERDRKAILDYLGAQEGEVMVAHILTDSGADRLRVYPLLFELEQEGLVTVTKENDLGTPETVRLS